MRDSERIGETVAEVAERTSDKIKKAGFQMKQGAENVADKAEQLGQQVKSASSDHSLREMEEALIRGKDRLVETAEDLYGDLSAAIKKNPGQSLLLGLALGVSAWAVMKRLTGARA